VLHEDPGDHVAGVRVFEALTGKETWRAVLGRLVDQLDRTPGAARLLAQPRGERLVAEVVGDARGMREQLARCGSREGIEGAPAVMQLGASCTASGSSSARRPSLASLTATAAVTLLVTLAARKASSAWRARLFTQARFPPARPHTTPAPGASTRASARGTGCGFARDGGVRPAVRLGVGLELGGELVEQAAAGQ
jgi:hypothetical protein